MRFPLVLDMNKYVDDPGQAEGGGTAGGAGGDGAPGGIVRERSDFQVGQRVALCLPFLPLL